MRESKPASEHRTEFVILRVTPAEKLAALRMARKHGYRGSVSALIRAMLAQLEKTSKNDKSTQVYETGALVTTI